MVTAGARFIPRCIRFFVQRIVAAVHIVSVLALAVARGGNLFVVALPCLLGRIIAFCWWLVNRQSWFLFDYLLRGVADDRLLATISASRRRHIVTAITSSCLITVMPLSCQRWKLLNKHMDMEKRWKGGKDWRRISSAKLSASGKFLPCCCPYILCADGINFCTRFCCRRFCAQRRFVRTNF